MNVRKHLGAVVLGLAWIVANPALAQEKFVGSWVLNAAKSEGPPGGVPPNVAVDISNAGGGMYKSVSVTTQAAGTTHSEITFGVDGKEYPTVTTPERPGVPPITQSFERVSDTSYKTTLRLGAGGQVIATMLNELSDDGKSLKLTTTGVGPFVAMSNKLVFDRKK